MFAFLAGCAHDPRLQDHPLVGRIWDARAARFVPAEEVFDRAARARHVILGETHDNPEHHRLQLAVLNALGGQPRTLAMEQF
ncbi:MAG TPA: ChaN family lipoprotein, partial [Burkholderiales bacterium]